MPRIVVFGLFDCLKYVHIEYVGQFLAKELSDFDFKSTPLSLLDWEKFIKDINIKNKWNYYHSPIIWKELAMSGGTPHLIGGASEFWEYCYEYYGLVSELTTSQREDLSLNVLRKFLSQERMSRDKRRNIRHRQFTISGAGNLMTGFLISQLLLAPELQWKDGLTIKLYESRGMEDVLKAFVTNAKGLGADAGVAAARIVHSLQEGLEGCEVLIILDHIPRLRDETLNTWLGRNKTAMQAIAAELNLSASPLCRVVCASAGHESPCCFNATVLADLADKLSPSDIVAVTAHLGFEAKTTVGQMVNAAIVDMAVPPVWGFVGINKYVDVHHTIFADRVFMPNKRVRKKMPQGSTLPKGRFATRVGTMGHLTYPLESKIATKVLAQRKAVVKYVGRRSYLARVQATVQLLTAWYSSGKGDPLISLGILSDGSFDIPLGMNFSQQVCLRNEKWVPYLKSPVPKGPHVKLKCLFPFAVECLNNFKIGKRFGAHWCMDAEELQRMEESKVAPKDERIIKQTALLKKRKEALINRKMILKNLAEKVTAEYNARINKLRQEQTVESAIDLVVNTALDTCLPYPVYSPTNVHVLFDNKVDALEAEQGDEDNLDGDDDEEEENDEDENDDDEEDEEEDD